MPPTVDADGNPVSSTMFKVTLCAGMLIFGSMNTLVTKLADVTSAQGVPNQPPHDFDHPFVQAFFMFIGEFLCLFAFLVNNYKLRKQGKPEDHPKAGFKPWVFCIPATMDMFGTSLMYVGLTLTYASVFQMLRGSVVIFTGILSVVFLGRKLYGYHWFGMLLVLMGLTLVGVASVLDSGSSANAKNPLLGDILVVIAQVVVSVQMVVEEKLLGAHDVPALQAVGWEGLFGMIVAIILNGCFYFIPGNRGGNHFENPADAVLQISNSPIIMLSLVGTLFSIAFFNYFGVSVTKNMSATTRMVLDSIRTFTIWAFSLIVGWEKFQWLQVAGFVLLLSGTCVYNKIIILPFLPPPKTAQEERLMDDQDSEAAGGYLPVNSQPSGRKK